MDIFKKFLTDGGIVVKWLVVTTFITLHDGWSQPVSQKDIIESEGNNIMEAKKTIGLVFDFDYTLCFPTRKFEFVFEEYFKVRLADVESKWLGAIFNKPHATGLEIIHETFDHYNGSELKIVASEFAQAWASVHELYPGVQEMLLRLRARGDVKLAILTNGPTDFQRAIINFLGLTNLVDIVMTSGDPDVCIRKPDPRIFKKLQEKLGLEAQCIYMVGDGLEKDVLGAERVGWRGIWVQPEDSGQKAQSISFEEFLATAKRNAKLNPLGINWKNLAI